MTARLLKAQYEALAAFRHELRRFVAFSAEAAQRAGLTPQQHQALLSIKGAPGRETLAVGEIAAHLLVRHHSAVELVDRLAELGLVIRVSDPSDGRRVQVMLTPRAETVLHTLSAVTVAELATIRPRLAALMETLDPAVVAAACSTATACPVSAPGVPAPPSEAGSWRRS